VSEIVSTGHERPPTPLLAGVALSALVGLGFVIAAVVSVVAGTAGDAVLWLLVAAAIGISAYGMWRKWSASWYLVLAMALFSLVTAVLSLFDPDGSTPVVISLARAVVSAAIAALLLIPASSRAYFRAPEEPAAEVRRGPSAG
jgi:hypothetical protein